MNTRNNMRFGSKSSSYTPQQGDVLLVDFGGKGKAGRNLAGCRPVYVVSSQTDVNHRGLVWAIPLFREISRDCDGQDIKIEPGDCRGLRYVEYAQPMNIYKIRSYRIVRRIGHVNNANFHKELVSTILEQIKERGVS